MNRVGPMGQMSSLAKLRSTAGAPRGPAVPSAKIFNAWLSHCIHTNRRVLSSEGGGSGGLCHLSLGVPYAAGGQRCSEVAAVLRLGSASGARPVVGVLCEGCALTGERSVERSLQTF